MYNETILGTCSICGGEVVIPTLWWCTIPPVPTCRQCGATQRQRGPVIDMVPRQRPSRRYGDSTGTFTEPDVQTISWNTPRICFRVDSDRPMIGFRSDEYDEELPPIGGFHGDY